MHKSDDEILELITGRIHGELTEEQDRLLDQWLAESDIHIEIFRDFEILYSRSRQLNKNFVPEVEPALGKLKKRRRHYINRIRWTVAATVALLLGLAGSTLYFVNHSDRGTRDFTAIAQPGQEKAILKQAGVYHLIPEQLDGNELSFSSAVIQLSDQYHILNYSDTISSVDKMVTATDSRDELFVPKGGEFQVILADGTKVWLNSVTTLKYPRRFTGGERRIQLIGEAYFEVSHDPEKPFIVETPGMDVRVLGTAFNINAYEGEESVHTTLVNGKVDVLLPDDQHVVLLPGEQLMIKNDSLIKKEVSLRRFTSWKEGRFLFENTTLEEISKQISRWYDVDVFFMSEHLKHICFTGGMIRFKPLEELIEMIETTSQVRFSVKDKTIVISGY